MDDIFDIGNSDDELLGIPNNPIKLKTISKNTWTQCRKSKRKKSPRNDNQSSQNIVHYPNIELIDVNNVNVPVGITDATNKFTKYQRFKEIKDVKGFIVNIHDAANFDIDLVMNSELHNRYHNVISNQYTYHDLEDDFFDNPYFSQIKIIPEIGTTYRCRLKGIGINKLHPQEYTWKSNQLCVEVKQLIDRTDCWVVCNLSDIDVYQRLLVDIFIHTSTESINLREYLLSRMEQETNPLFYPYNCKRYKTNNPN